jgi:phospholipid/cholesterol/gamma-HCH transport system substrate-binding protein
VKKAISKHLGDFVAMTALFILALGVGGYILFNQRLHFPLIQKKPIIVKVQFDDAQAVQPGQGQTVRTAGVEIGQIGKVHLKDGKALVEMQLEGKYKNFVKQNATALLRSKTGLKDMFIEVDPGTGKPLKENGTIPSKNTAPDIDPDEILASLDTDTRAYLKLLISGAGKGLKGRGSDLQETFARLGPVNHDLARVNSAVATRKRNLKRLINRYGLLTAELGAHDRDIVRLVRSSNDVFQTLASDNNEISATVAKLPSTLNTTKTTLSKVNTLGQRLTPALNALRPPFRKLDTANRAVLPLVREATPEIRDQIRPFARAARPFTRDLGSASKNLAKAGPDYTTSFGKLNRLFNIGAFNPGGAQGLTGNPATDRNRQEGYLYWLAWTATNTNSLFNTADASGPLRRIALGGVNCAILKAIITGTTGEAGSQIPAIGPLVTPTLDEAVGLLGTAGLCTP